MTMAVLSLHFWGLARGVGHWKDTFIIFSITKSPWGRNRSISKGNLFIIRLDEKWLPTIFQVSGRLTERIPPDKVLKFFKSILRHDETIQRLELSE